MMTSFRRQSSPQPKNPKKKQNTIIINQLIAGINLKQFDFKKIQQKKNKSLKKKMNTTLISNTISEISLYLDLPTLEEIRIFIQTFLGNSWEINPKLYIYVCTAIVCQCKKIPAIQSKIEVPFGINVEKIMKYYSNKSKQDFLITMMNIAQKWSTCPQLFINKLGYLRLSYRIFKKYQDICMLIGGKKNIKSEINSLNICLFWIVFLQAKYIYNQSQSLEVMTNIVPLLIQEIYVNYLQVDNRGNIAQLIGKYMSYPDIQCNSVKECQMKYSKQLKKLLSESYSRRYLTQKTDFNFLLHKPEVLERLIDDLSNRHSKMIETSSQEFVIDQMSFLQLKKDMAPEAFHQRIDKNQLIINQKLYFENQIIVLSTPKKLVAGGEQQQKYQFTPCTLRTQNLAWIRNCIEDLQQDKIEKVEEYYKQYNTKNFKNFYQSIESKIQRVIEQFSPTCKNYSKRKIQIYNFFIYCINIAIQMYSDQIQKIFNNDESLCSIFCLCTQIFNFIYQAYSGNYSRYCEIFEIQFSNAFFPINWFGYYIKLPKNVDDHLYQLERKFLLKEIWNTEVGFRIISNRQETVKINQLRMMERLWKHVKSRIDEICRETVGEKMVKRIYNMVNQILEKKPVLLQRNNIDQIIICSIMACLSLNEDSNRISLDKIFLFYCRISLSSDEDRVRLLDRNNNELNIVQFYNNVFLEEIQQIINKYPETSSLLSTPKRLALADRYKVGMQIMSGKQKCGEQSSFLKKKIERNEDPQYQLKYILYNTSLARNIQMQQEQYPMIEESEQSAIENENKDNLK